MMDNKNTYSLLELEYIVQRKEKDSKVKALKVIDTYLQNMSNPAWNLAKTINLELKPDKDYRYTYNLISFGQNFFTRLTNVIGKLILDLNENENEDEDEKEICSLLNTILTRKNTLDYIFSNSIYSSADHLLKLLLKDNDNKLKTKIAQLKFKIFYSLESDLPVHSIESILSFSKEDYFSFSLYLLSSSVVATKNSTNNKNSLLKILPPFIDSLKKEDLNTIDTRFLCSLYFNCTYSSIIEKHKIKASIHDFVKRLALVNINDQNSNKEKLGFAKNNSKKSLLIIHERFTSNHALFRCYSQVLNSLKEEYNLIGVTQFKDNTDEISKNLFDKHFVFDVTDCLQKIKELVDEYRPVATYFPSIGMESLTIFASSYKFTKKYILSSGHPAPTHNPNIDYIIHYKDHNISLDSEDHVVYKELSKLIPVTLSKRYNKPVDDWVLLKNINMNENINTIKIAITSSAYKLNLSMIKMIASLQDLYQDKIEFNYFIAGSRGTIFFKIASILYPATNGRLKIFPHQLYEDYMLNLSKCHLFLSPFPFGMSNSLMDCVSQGLLGPCLSGSTIVQDCEQKMFKSLGLSKFICSNETEYLELMCELINCFLKKEGQIIEDIKSMPKPQSSIKNMSNWTDDDYQEFKEIFNSCINE